MVSAARSLVDWFVEEHRLDADLGSDSRLQAWVRELEGVLQNSHVELSGDRTPRDALVYLLALGLTCTYIHDVSMCDLVSEELVANIPRTRAERSACSAFMRSVSPAALSRRLHVAVGQVVSGPDEPVAVHGPRLGRGQASGSGEGLSARDGQDRPWPPVRIVLTEPGQSRRWREDRERV